MRTACPAFYYESLGQQLWERSIAADFHIGCCRHQAAYQFR